MEISDKNNLIPQNLAEALAQQPLNYLVPKSLAFEIAGSQIQTSVSLNKRETDVAKSDEITSLEGFLLETTDQDNFDRLIFKRPKYKLSGNNKSNSNMFEGLSSTALSIMNASKLSVESEQIVGIAEMNAIKTGSSKRSASISHLVNTSEDVEEVKRIKVVSGSFLKQEDITDQYLNELKSVLSIISNVDSSNLEYWQRLSHTNSVMSESFISSIHNLSNNMSSINLIWSRIDSNDLKILLKALLNNLELLTETVINDVKTEVQNLYKKIAYLSTATIFIILSAECQTTRLNLVNYITLPIHFLEERIYNLGQDDKNENTTMLTELSLLCQSIPKLPAFLIQNPYLDENLISKLAYMFSGIVMNFDFDASNLQVLHFWNELKFLSVEILKSLFKVCESQRIFIIEDLLNHIENVPTKRLQKKMRKLSSGTYITEFTYLVMCLLQSLQANTFNLLKSDFKEDEFSDALTNYRVLQNHIESYIEHINNTLMEKFQENPSAFRHVLENYTQDLLNVLTIPEWSIAEELLSSITKKLLLLFASSSPKTTLVESAALQIIGNIGSATFDIKCKTSPTDANNFIKIFNDPEELPKYIEKVKICLNFDKLYQNSDDGVVYFWNRFIGNLVRLEDMKAQENSSNSFAVPEIVAKEIFAKNEMQLSLNEMKNISRETAYFSILHSFEILNLYDLYLKLIVSLLDKNKIKLRSTAIKCLSMLAFKDSNILYAPSVKETIIERLHDNSASVKDAILDLVTIGTAPILFYQHINHNFDDESILVRKHVLKINELIYDSTQDKKIKVFVASRILLRIEDEEDAIIASAKEILLKRWISSVEELAETPDKQNEVCEEIITIMSEVALVSDKSAELFDWFLNFYLLNKEEHTRLDFIKISKSLNKLTNYLVHSIVDLQSAELENDSDLKKQQCLFNLLSKFSDSTETFITKDHLFSLYPYLVSDGKTTFQYHILCVFKNIMTHLQNFKPKFLYEVETVLLSKLPRLSVQETEEAMPLLWCTASKRKNYERISKACSSCLAQLVPFVNQANKNSRSIEVTSKLQRLIYLATGFARFCNSKLFDEKIKYIQQEQNLYEYVAKCLLVLSHKNIPHQIRRVAIKNMTKLCGSHPKLFNSKHILTSLDKEFESDAMDIKLVIAESLYDFFLQEEKKSLRKVGNNRFVSSNQLKSKLTIEKKSETISDGICSALVSRFLKPILDLCLSKDVKKSLAAVRLLRVILQYGYTNPSYCIPTMIALTNSNDKYMRQVAVKTLGDVFEKYETLVLSRVGQGIKLAFEYAKTLEDANFYTCDNLMKNLQTVLVLNKSHANNFKKLVIKTLNNSTNNLNHASATESTLNLVLFLCCNISRLTFEVYEELLPLMKSINASVEQWGEMIVDEINDEPKSMVLEKPYKNFILIDYCLRELNSYFKEYYNINFDILSLDEAEQSEMKSKPVTTTNTATNNFCDVVTKFLGTAQKKQFYVKRLIALRDEE